MYKKIISLEMAIQNKGSTVTELFKKVDPDNTIIFSDMIGTLIEQGGGSSLSTQHSTALTHYLIGNGKLVVATSAPIDLVEKIFLTPLNYNGDTPLYIISAFNSAVYRQKFGQMELYYRIKDHIQDKSEGIEFVHSMGHACFPKRHNIIFIGDSEDDIRMFHSSYSYSGRYGFFVGEKQSDYDTIEKHSSLDTFFLRGAGISGTLDVLNAINTPQHLSLGE